MDNETENQVADSTIEETPKTETKYVLKRGRRPVRKQCFASEDSSDSEISVDAVCNDAIAANSVQSIEQNKCENVEKTTEIVDDGLDAKYARPADEIKSDAAQKQRTNREGNRNRSDRNARERSHSENCERNQRRDRDNSKKSKDHNSSCCKDYKSDLKKCNCKSECSLLCTLKRFFSKLFGKKNNKIETPEIKSENKYGSNRRRHYRRNRSQRQSSDN